MIDRVFWTFSPKRIEVEILQTLSHGLPVRVLTPATPHKPPHRPPLLAHPQGTLSITAVLECLAQRVGDAVNPRCGRWAACVVAVCACVRVFVFVCGVVL